MEYYDGQIITDHTAFANWANSHRNIFSDRSNGDGTYTIYAIPAPTPEEEKQARIAELKAQLDGTDYKIIKCSECQLAGVELPYDIVALHAERQAIRDEINQLEGE